MTLVRYNTDYTPKTFSSLIDRFFNELAVENRMAQFTPAVDYIETDRSYELQLALPGLKKDDFKIEVDHDTLVVEGERKFVNEQKDKTYHSIETRYGAFRRAFSLPDNVKVENIEANYTDGILTITLPKDEAKKLKSVIKVK